MLNELRKAADLGGRGNDTSFEEAFSSLAHAHVRERAPGLMDYELGFQLLDRNDDDTKAVGVIGFKVAKQTAFVPVFFLNGQIKGHETIYLKEQDQVRPLKEAWINRLLRRNPLTLGDSVSRDNYAFGSRMPRLQDLAWPGILKTSAAAEGIRGDLLPGVSGLARVLISPLPKTEFDLGEYLKKSASAPLLRSFVRMCKQYPRVKAAFAQFYDVDDLLKSALNKFRPGVGAGVFKVREAVGPYKPGDPAGVFRAAEEKSKKDSDCDKMAAVTVLRYGVSMLNMEELSKDKKDKLLRDGFIIDDKRDDEGVSRAYRIKTSEELTNPERTGMYDVLLRSGEFKRCLVLVNPYSVEGQKTGVLVVTKEANDGKRDSEEAQANQVWVRRRGEDPTGQPYQEDYREFFAGLKEAEELPISNRSNRYVLLDGAGRGTCSFSINGYNNEGGAPKLKVWMDDYDYRSPSDDCSYDSDGIKSQPRAQFKPYRLENKRAGYGGAWICFTDRKDAAIRATGRELYLPRGLRYLPIVDDDESGPPDFGEINSSSEKPVKIPFVLGDESDLREYIMRKTAALKVAHDGSEVKINGGARSRPAEAVISLVTGWGLREADARAIVKEAAAKRVATFQVKLATPYGHYQGPGPGAPDWPEPLEGGGIMSDHYPEIYAQNELMPGEPRTYDLPDFTRQPIPDRNALSMVMTAAQTGQKDIFDATALASLWSSADSYNDSDLPVLKSAVDKLGRRLLKLFANGEEWQERFGKADMPALENELRKNFEGLGDLVLELETKETDMTPGEEDFVQLDQDSLD